MTDREFTHTWLFKEEELMAKPSAKPNPTHSHRYTIEVTPKDIARAHQNDSYKCVVVQAIARTIPDAHRIEVDTQAVRFTRTTTGSRYVYLTPYAVQGYVIAFDAGDKIEPFRFQLNERGMIRAKRKIYTAAGNKANAAAYRARAKVRKTRAKPVLGSDAPVTLGSDAAVLSEPVSARAAYAQARTEHPGQASHTGEGDRYAPRRVFKSRIREYGHRLLRINQPKAAAVPSAE